MTALILGVIALAAVVLSFALVALTLIRAMPNDGGTVQPVKSRQIRDDKETAPETMSRVLGDIERLAALKERGALTATEFAVAKTNFLRVAEDGDRAAVRPGTS